MLPQQREERAQPTLQEGIIPGVGIVQPALLPKADRPFRQTFKNQIIEIGVPEQFHGRLQPVSAEPGAATDAYHIRGLLWS